MREPRRYLLAALVGAVLSLAAYEVWAVNANPVPGSVWTWLGPTFGADWAPFPTSGIDPTQFGCVGNGIANDTACMQAAINAAQSNGATRPIISLGPHCYGISGTLTITYPVTIIGTGMGPRVPPPVTTCNSGFKVLAANVNLFNIVGTAIATRLEQFTILGPGPLANSSGAYITNNAPDLTVRQVSIFYPCIGIDEWSNESRYQDNIIGYVSNAGPNCVGMVVGAHTNNANTIGTRITGNLIFGDPAQVHFAKAGMEFQDAGGPYVEMNDILYFNVGTLIDPQTTGQELVWGFFSNTVLGDTDNTNDLVIRPALQNSGIWGLQFTGSWAANAQNGTPVVIDNTVGAQISGIRFLGARIYNRTGTNGVGSTPTYNMVDINPGAVAGLDGIEFTNSAICSQASSTATGINVETNLFSNIRIQDNRIGQCDHGALVGTLAVGISLPTGSIGNQVYTITGNTFLNVTTPISWTPNGEQAIVKDNNGLNEVYGTGITAAATINLPTFDFVTITGATPIAAMNGFWRSRVIQLIALSALNFVDGNGASPNMMCGNQPTTFPVGALIAATWAGCWYLK